jgi:hypothetical protein
MAVNNIEEKSLNRFKDRNKAIKHQVTGIGADLKPKNFDNFKLSCQYAKL